MPVPPAPSTETTGETVAPAAAASAPAAVVEQAGQNDDQPEEKCREAVQAYDFRHPAFLSPGELRRLRLRHEEFIRALAARLSIYLRLEFALRLTRLEAVPYQKFIKGLPNPTHLTLFKIEPLRGLGVLHIPPRLGLTIVDRLLGGSAQSVTADHEFSEIEMALLDQCVTLLLHEYGQHWAGVQELRPALLGHETNGQFLQTAPHDTLLLVLGLEARLGDCLEPMELALPCHTLEPLIRQLGQFTDVPPPDPRLPLVALRWNRAFDDLLVPVTAIWNDVTMTARSLANLKPGDMLPLDRESLNHVKLRLADRPKFEGRLGTTNGKWAVAVTGVMNPPSA